MPASTVIIPDLMGALLTILRADTQLVALCSQNLTGGAPPRINTTFPEASDPTRRWVLPDYAIIIRRAGGASPDMELNLRYARVDVTCYGAGKTIGIRRRTADQLWRNVDPVLCPPIAPSSIASFHTASTLIHQIYPESEPIPSIEPDTDWARVTCVYVVTYAAKPVP